MSLDENVAESINAFKELVQEIDEHTDDSAYFCKLRQHADWIAHDIERIHSGYYVAFVEYGPDDNFVRTWHLLGFMTAEKAYEILNEELVPEDSEPWNESGIKEVSQEAYDKYRKLVSLQMLYNNLHVSQDTLHDILPTDFMDEVRSKVFALREELGLKYLWERVSSRF